MKSRPFEQLFSVGTGFCMGFLKSSKTDHNPFLFKNCKYKAKAAQIKRFKRLMLSCVDKKDAGAKSCAARVCGLLRLDFPFCNSNPQHLVMTDE